MPHIIADESESVRRGTWLVIHHLTTNKSPRLRGQLLTLDVTRRVVSEPTSSNRSPLLSLESWTAYVPCTNRTSTNTSMAYSGTVFRIYSVQTGKTTAST